MTAASKYAARRRPPTRGSGRIAAARALQARPIKERC